MIGVELAQIIFNPLLVSLRFVVFWFRLKFYGMRPVEISRLLDGWKEIAG